MKRFSTFTTFTIFTTFTTFTAFTALRLFQVEHDAALAAVQSEKHVTHARIFHRTRMAHVVAFVGFDLDHVGAQLGEDLGCERTHDDGGEVEDLHPFQWTWQLRFVIRVEFLRRG